MRRIEPNNPIDESVRQLQILIDKLNQQLNQAMRLRRNDARRRIPK